MLRCFWEKNKVLICDWSFFTSQHVCQTLSNTQHDGCSSHIIIIIITGNKQTFFRLMMVVHVSAVTLHQSYESRVVLTKHILCLCCFSMTSCDQ